MATQAEELRERLRNVQNERKDFVAKFASGDVPSVEDEAHLEAMVNGEADIKDSLARLARFDAARGAPVVDLSARNPATDPRVTSPAPRQTIGRRFVEDPAFKAWLTQVAPNGRIPDGAKINSPSFSFGGLSELGMMASLLTGDSSTSGGAFVVADRFPELVDLGRRPLRIRDVIRVLQTSSDLVEYVRQTSRTNNADTVAEATAAGDGSGVKPESASAWEVDQAPVKTIANWIPVTKQAVSDVPQLRGIIDTELRDNLEEALEDQIVNGSGSGSDLTGITNTSGTQTGAWVTNILTTTRKSRTLVGTVGRRIPNAYLLNPADWETIDLLQDNEARYFFGGPAAMGTPRLWGLPVVETEVIVAGTGLVGDFTRAILWDREAANIAISDSHADFFVRNLLAVLAELRAAFALTQPSAIVEMDLTA